jgi:hypothetical protein
VNGGRLYGSWPGLGLVADGGDLPVTTDYRAVLAELCATRLASDPAAVFPGYVRPAPLGLARAR